LHQSLATVLVNKSPLHCWYKAFREKLDGEPEEYSERRTLGSICHSLILGGQDVICVEADDWRTKLAKESRAEIIKAGKLPILKSAFENAQETVNALMDRMKAEGLVFDEGLFEQTAIWTAPNGVECEGRLDWLKLGKLEGTIIDFKFTSVPADKKKCERSFIDLGYDIQETAYRQAIERIYPNLAGRVKTLYVFCEVNKPNAVRIMPVGGTMRHSGAMRWGQALERWKECLERYGTETPWPGYADNWEQAECPPWALNEQRMELDTFDPGQEQEAEVGADEQDV
jgi:hypothetical protein